MKFRGKKTALIGKFEIFVNEGQWVCDVIAEQTHWALLLSCQISEGHGENQGLHLTFYRGATTRAIMLGGFLTWS